VQTQIFLAVIKNVFDFIAHRKTVFFVYCGVTGVKNAVNIFSQQNSI